MPRINKDDRQSDGTSSIIFAAMMKSVRMNCDCEVCKILRPVAEDILDKMSQVKLDGPKPRTRTR
jgi:hypothetical protein